MNRGRVVSAWAVIAASLAGGALFSACQREPTSTVPQAATSPSTAPPPAAPPATTQFAADSGQKNATSRTAPDAPAPPDSPPVAADAAAPATAAAETAPDEIADGDPAGVTAIAVGYTADAKKKPALDPVAVNGKIFEGWDKPALAIVLSGEQNGYLEPCGCAGLENQKGGLSRRWTMLAERRQAGWEVLPLDVGGLVRRYGPQAEIQYQVSANVLKAMGYAAVGYGPADLRLPGPALVQAIGDDLGDKSLFVAANVGVFGFDGGFVARYRVVERGGLRVGITSVVGETYQQEVNNGDVQMRPAAAALEELLPELIEKSDLRVLLAHATPEESRALAAKFPDFDVVVTAGGADEPPQEPAEIEGTSARLIEVGHKGMYCVVVGVYPEADPPLRYQRVPLDSRFADAPQVHEQMAAYQDQLRLAGWDGLGIRTAQHPRATKPGDPAGQFVGAERCGTCHKQAFAKWKETKHAHATETLTKLSPPRQFDPECISCHSVGWHPKEYYPYDSGYVSLETTPALTGNACENCHGPGRGHSEAEEARPRRLAERDRMRQAMRLTKATAKESVCEKCHDLDNSPEFHKDGAFDRYWAKVEHKGKD